LHFVHLGDAGAAEGGSVLASTSAVFRGT